MPVLSPVPAGGPSAGERCGQCGAVRTDPTRPYYPLWFYQIDGAAICPACVPMQTRTPTLSVVVEARALIVRAGEDHAMGDAWPRRAVERDEAAIQRGKAMSQA